MSASVRILLLEDEPAQRLLLAAYLRQAGFQVQEAAALGAARALVAHEPPHLALVDLNLPDGDGLDLARELRRLKVPVVILTCRAEDRVRALEGSADDFLDKPFDPRELLARVRNLLRRSGLGGGATGAVLGPYRLDRERRQVLHESGVPLALTRGEYEILAELAEARGRALCRAELAEAVSADGQAGSLRSVDVLVSRLRRKLEADPGHPRLLLTVPGYGYRVGE